MKGRKTDVNKFCKDRKYQKVLVGLRKLEYQEKAPEKGVRKTDPLILCWSREAGAGDANFHRQEV